MAGLLCRIEYVLESLMERHLDNSTSAWCLVYTQATLRNTVNLFYRGPRINLCYVIQPFVSLAIKQRLSFGPECMSIITINRIKATNSSTSSPRIKFFSISRFYQIVSISSLVKISATRGSISLGTSILKKSVNRKSNRK